MIPPFDQEPPDVDEYLPIETFVAGAISTLPPFSSHHPAYALPLARRAINAMQEYEPEDAYRHEAAPVIDDECGSCGMEEHGVTENECPRSKRECGHHCNCVWVHDKCDWCGAMFGDVDDPDYGKPKVTA